MHGRERLSYRLRKPLLVPVFLWFLHYVVAKHDAYFTDDPERVVVHAQGTEDGTRREAARVNPRNVAASEEASGLKSRRHGKRRHIAAGTVQQIDRVLSGGSRTRNVFPAHGEREAVFEGMTQQYLTAVGRRALHGTDLRVGGHTTVLIVGLDDPGPLRIRVDDRVHAAVVLHRGGTRLKLCLTQISHSHERQAMGPIGIGQGTAQVRVAVGIETVVPTQ